jgi:integrase
MASIKLTQPAVDALPVRDTAYLAYDSALKGFALRVNPTGRKVWLIEYRPSGGGRGVAKRRHTFGSTATITAADARVKAKKLLGGVQNDQDPAGDRSEQRDAPTISALGDQFIDEAIEPKKKPRTVELYRGYLRLHVLPEIGSRKAREVTHADVAKLHRRIAGKGARVTANRVVTFLGGLYTWAGKMALVPKGTNPAAGIERFKEEGRERFLSDDEIKRLGATLALAETHGLPFEVDETRPTAKHARKPENRRTVISAHATGAVRLLLLTGCRLREVLHLRWKDVDLKRALFTIVDGKTGRRHVWLNAPAVAVLDALAEIRIGDFVIAGEEDDKPRADLQKPWAQIVKHAELDGVTLHTLRHTHASVGVGAGFGLPVVGALLGHRQSSTTAKYAHIADSPARRASEAIGAALAAGMGGPSAEVIPLPAKVRAAR